MGKFDLVFYVNSKHFLTFLIKRMGKNDYLNEFKYFNPWILHSGLVTWVPEVRLHTKCVIKVSKSFIFFNFNFKSSYD